MFNRRHFLNAVGGGVVGLAALGSTRILRAQSPASLNTLAIPPLLNGQPDNALRRYALTVRRGSSQFLPDRSTPTFGINGDYLGPTLRLSRGDAVAIRVSNQLGEATTMHWHGMHVPVTADGGPHQVIEDGDDWEARFTVLQRGATCWYHSHVLDRTGYQVYHGLSGLIIIDDEETRAESLPSEYGVDDIPLIIQDRTFNEDGSFRYIGMPMDVMAGMYGDAILVNGTLNPRFAPTRSRTRFRLLNGSNARVYTLAFSDRRPFQLIASDGGLLESPVTLTSLELAPAERVEILVDFSDGNATRLVSLPMAVDSPNNAVGMMGNMLAINQQAFDILSLEPAAGLRPAAPLPRQLARLETVSESDAQVQRRLVLSMTMGMMGGGRGPGGPGGANRGRGMMGGFQINGEAMDMAVINQRVTLGSTEIWTLVNDSMMMHPFHIHHGQFRILDRNGSPPALHERGYKDTVKVGPGETVRFIMRFENFSNASQPYMYHCHILEHEDNGMMGQFTVA